VLSATSAFAAEGVEEVAAETAQVEAQVAAPAVAEVEPAVDAPVVEQAEEQAQVDPQLAPVQVLEAAPDDGPPSAWVRPPSCRPRSRPPARSWSPASPAPRR
jgi:hypothetical protein